MTPAKLPWLLAFALAAFAAVLAWAARARAMASVVRLLTAWLLLEATVALVYAYARFVVPV